jgi:HAD superfamily hydrolase (TIGR01509 family)
MLVAGIRAILFDFGGTLDYPRHWLDRFVEHYRDAGLAIDRNDLDPAYESATRRGYEAVGEMRERNLCETVRFLVKHQLSYLSANGPKRVRDYLEMGGQRSERIAHQVSDAFVEQSARGLARSRRVLDALKPRFDLGVVSNFYGNLDRILAEYDLANLFGTIVDSSAIGAFKPDPRIFERALADLGLSGRGGCAAMVGDSPAKDCAPARRLGMRTVWLRTSDCIEQGSRDFADTVVDSLDEILRLEW